MNDAKDANKHCGPSSRSVLESARFYIGQGFSVIPLAPRSEVPHFELLKAMGSVDEEGEPTWMPYASRQPTEEELTTWFDEETTEEVEAIRWYGAAGIAGITGLPNGYVAFDGAQRSGKASRFLVGLAEPCRTRSSFSKR